MADAHAIASALVPIITLLAFGVAAAVGARAAGRNPIVGRLVPGLGLGGAGMGVAPDMGTVTTLAELGVVFLLFDIGLHFSLGHVRKTRLGEIWTGRWVDFLPYQRHHTTTTGRGSIQPTETASQQSRPPLSISLSQTRSVVPAYIRGVRPNIAWRQADGPLDGIGWRCVRQRYGRTLLHPPWTPSCSAAAGPPSRPRPAGVLQLR